MRANLLKMIRQTAHTALTALLLASGAATAAVPLTAGPTMATLPDGQAVPMWGYTCGTPTSGEACAALNPSAGSGWSPVVIRVPYVGASTSLTINLTNNLPAGIPTSLVIVGQLGGGLGTTPTRTDSPAHAVQTLTWPAAGGLSDPVFTSPSQLPRVQSFATEVAATGVTPVSPQVASGSALTWSNLKPGTYLIESGTHPSIQGPMGLYGVLVVTTSATAGPPATLAQAYPGVSYNADLPLLLSEIDPVQNATVAAAVAKAGFSETRVWSGQTGECGDPASATYLTCYPPAVNYDPRYYLINGVSFDRTAMSKSQFAVSAPASTGQVLVRFVNAGLRMHVPAIVGALTGTPAVSGFSLIAEDGNVLPGNRKVQSEVFLAAGKTYDVMLNAPASSAPALPVYDRQLSLSTNNQRDGGMQAYLSVNGGALPSTAATLSAATKTYYCVAGTTLAVTDPGKGVLGGSTGANGAALGTVSLSGGAMPLLTFQSNGTFAYAQLPAETTCGGTFTYLVNGTTTKIATITQCDVNTPGCAALGASPTANADNYASKIASRFQIGPPGVLANDTDPTGLPLKASAPSNVAGGTVTLNPDGSFTATPTTPPTGTGTAAVSFQYNAVNSQNRSSSSALVTVTFNAGNGKNITVVDAVNGGAISDYRWIIEEDRSFYVDPVTQVNNRPACDATHFPPNCGPIPTLGTNFHTSNMPVVAQGCVGAVSCEAGQLVFDPTTNSRVSAVCDIGNGSCRPGDSKTPVGPSQVVLDPAKRYYLSILPGDGVNTTIGGATGPVQVDPNCNPATTNCAMRQFDIGKECGSFDPGNGTSWEPGGANALCGHAMGGAQIAVGQTAVKVVLQQTPLPTSKVSVFVFEDDFPLNGENDAGGGVDVLAPNEPGLGSFNIVILDQGGTMGDSTGQITYDMFNMPVSNSLAGTIDPLTGRDACPITQNPDRLVGMIPTCPTYEADVAGQARVLSPLAGQAVVANLYPGLYEIVATPGADRIGRGEEWLQTNTLDGTKAIEAFLKAGEPAYFQEYGPGGFHVAIGFANPKIITDRKTNTGHFGLCDPTSSGGGGLTCAATIKGQVTNMHMSRTPDQRVYSSGDYVADSYTQCYVSLGPPDGADFDFAKCDPDGNFTFTNVPLGNYRVTVFDQWNDLLVDGLSTPIVVGTDANGQTNTTNTNCTGAAPAITCTYEIAVTQWRTNLYTRTFLDIGGNASVAGDGVSNLDLSGTPCTATNVPAGCNANYGNASEPGLTLVSTNIRYRDGSIGFFNNTDLNGYAGFNEVFPFLNWLVVETDSTRYKQTGVHVVNDAGGPVDGSVSCDPATAPCGNALVAKGYANTYESPTAHVPPYLRVPGAVYCENADCNGTKSPDLANPSTGRVDPPWVPSEAWQGLLGQSSIMEFGMKPFAPGENGGIKGHVIYASTRPFDDPALLLQLSWEPGVPNVRINLYQEGTAPDGSKTLKLVDHTTTTSFDDWAQGFRRNPNGSLMTVTDGNGVTRYVPNMSCPGQELGTSGNMFYFTLENSTQWLNPSLPIAENSRYKCFDGWSMLNQVQPAPYDGMYRFPSARTIDPTSGQEALQLDRKTYGTNCTVCTPNLDDGTPMLPAGKYVVEVIVPPGYELVKEEDKNILLGDVYVAPVTQQFAGLGNIFILPDQAAVNAYYNKNNKQNSTTNFGLPRHEGDTGSIEAFWPCVGAMRTVPEYNSLFPGAQQSAPFAGATRPLCDRKEVTLEDQMSALAKFYIFSSTHIAGHFTGAITNDFASEFDPFSPQFGEKFAPPNLPVSFKDFNGNEMGRVYSDVWGYYNGLNYSTYGVNPPNPTGYVPQMMIACMNDPGPVPDPAHPGQMITDPYYNSAYANFCYEIPFMPGQTAYLDTPVIPTMAFADNYNLADCAYPTTTPAILRVDGTGDGPWVGMSGSVASVTVGVRGSGYTTAPTVSFTPVDGNGSGAVANASMRVASITVNNPGRGYTSRPAVSINNTGSGGTGAAVINPTGVTLKVVGFQINSPGTCTSGNHTVTFTSGGPGNGSNNHAAATATLTNAGGVTALTITDDGGNYTGVPNVNVNNCTESVTALMGVRAISLTQGGSGYASQPAVTIANAPAGGTNASATAFLIVDSIAVTSGGSGYNAAPTVALSSGTATATATLGSLTVTSPITITSLGKQTVPNHAYSGPNAVNSPFNQKSITRDYGFGATAGSVSIGGVDATVTGWSDASITVTVPTNVPLCALQQRGQAPARCGELVVTAANGKKSIDAVTVTIGGKAPTRVSPTSASSTTFGQILPNPLQTAIDNAAPGDLIIVEPGTYNEMLLMWKPVRLQGVGAASVVINANAHPAGKLDPWRSEVACLFGLAPNGQPATGNYGQCSIPGIHDNPMQVDRIPLEGILGWDTTLNGNLAQLLQEPTLMGAYEGAGITVLGKGVRFDCAASRALGLTTGCPFGNGDIADANSAHEGQMPIGTQRLTNSNQDCNDFPSNFLCNPSRIDGLTITNSSQGGGAIFAHGWAHNLEIANTRVYANSGTLSGGIGIGQGEFPDAYVTGNNGDPLGFDQAPWTCMPQAQQDALPVGTQLPYCLNTNTDVHHNMVVSNASYGDALYSGTPSGAGGVTFTSGSDYYQFRNNWVCGNLSTGDGGGVVHSGFNYNGNISNNWIIFNQSTNPTIPTNGGGLAVIGASPDRTLANGLECGNTAAGAGNDVDCPPGLPDGTGPGLVIDANLIMGNSAETGSGGGIRLQGVNGQDVATFLSASGNWHAVTVTNNIIANNVAGWDGGGVSLQDALKVSFVNNTVVANDTTASAGVLFNTLGAVNASVPPPGCFVDPNNAEQGLSCPPNPVPTSTPQAAGLVTMQNSPNLVAAMSGTVNCPSGFGYTNGNGANSCKNVSRPVLTNDLFWQNRAFHVEVGGLGSGSQNQQHLVYLEPLLNQTVTGMCSGTGLRNLPNVPYWDIGVRGDTGPSNHGSGVTLATTTSILSTNPDPGLLRQYCNGSRLPPENGGKGFNAPPGHSEATGLYPLFALNNITPAATVDEGNNWINLGYGPLSLIDPVGGSTVLGNYAIAAGSPAIDVGTATGAPTHDFFNRTRPQGAGFDIGAVEFVLASGAAASVSPDSADFGTVTQNTTSTAQTLTLHNNGTAGLTGITVTVTVPFSRSGGSCTATLASGATCTINVVFAAPALLGTSSGTATITTTQAAVSGSPVALSGTSVTPPIVSVSGGPLAFGSQMLGTTSATQTLTLHNTGGSPFTGITASFPAGSPYSRPAGVAGGSCGSLLAQGDGTTTGVCTINVVFSPVAVGVANSNVAITGNATVTGSPVALTGTGTAPTKPTLATLDNFNRANANNLGGNWQQAQIAGFAAISVTANQAANGLLPGYAIWSPTADFTAGQAVAFQFVNTANAPTNPVSGSSLILKGTGNALLQVPQNFVQVRYVRTAGAAADQVVVEYTTNNGGAFTTATNGTITLPAGVKFATGDTLTASVTSTGLVSVFRTTVANVTTYLGSAALPSAPLWTTGGGSIGIHLPGGLAVSSRSRVDNFAGGTLP